MPPGPGARAIPPAPTLRDALRRPLARALLAWMVGSAGLVAGTHLLLDSMREEAEAVSFAEADAEAALAEQAVLRAIETTRDVHALLGVWQALSDAGDTAGTAALEAHLRRIAAGGRLGVIQIGTTAMTAASPGAPAPMPWATTSPTASTSASISRAPAIRACSSAGRWWGAPRDAGASS